MKTHLFFKGIGAMAINVDNIKGNDPRDVVLDEVRCHLNAVGGAGNFVVSIGSAAGVEYNSVLSTTDMTGASEARYAPDNPPPIRAVDAIKCDWPNAGAKTWGVEIIYHIVD